VVVEEAWRQDKASKASSPEKGKLLSNFGSPISVRLGRIDAAQPSLAGRVPPLDAPLEEVQAFFTRLGARPDQTGDGPFAKKPPFWERQQVAACRAAPRDMHRLGCALLLWIAFQLSACSPPCAWLQPSACRPPRALPQPARLPANPPPYTHTARPSAVPVVARLSGRPGCH
jgi:hypothetical protein